LPQFSQWWKPFAGRPQRARGKFFTDEYYDRFYNQAAAISDPAALAMPPPTLAVPGLRHDQRWRRNSRADFPDVSSCSPLALLPAEARTPFILKDISRDGFRVNCSAWCRMTGERSARGTPYRDFPDSSKRSNGDVFPARAGGYALIARDLVGTPADKNVVYTEVTLHRRDAPAKAKRKQFRSDPPCTKPS